MCGSLLTIRNSYVHLIHQSAKDYLGTNASAKIFLGKADVHHSLFSRSPTPVSLGPLFSVRRAASVCADYTHSRCYWHASSVALYTSGAEESRDLSIHEHTSHNLRQPARGSR